MNQRLIKVKIKWFFILNYYRIKKFIWCNFFHKNYECYGHCDKCTKYGIGLDYLVEKSEAEND